MEDYVNLTACQMTNDIVSLKEQCSIRWLSLTCAVTAIRANLPALLMELDEDAARGNT